MKRRRMEERQKVGTALQAAAGRLCCGRMFSWCEWQAGGILCVMCWATGTEID
jgi:hypothetical protein